MHDDDCYHHNEVPRNRMPRTNYHGNSKIEAIEKRIDFLCLANMALWDLLKENTSLTEAHLIERMQDLDIQDGSLDGKVDKPPRLCSKCERRLGNQIQVCQYCSTFNPYQNAFEGAW